MPSKAWPIVNCFCEPTISVFDPPTYVVASLRKRNASFDERLDDGLWREVRSLPPSRAFTQKFHEDRDDARQEAAQVVSLTPRIIRWTSSLSPPYRLW